MFRTVVTDAADLIEARRDSGLRRSLLARARQEIRQNSDVIADIRVRIATDSGEYLDTAAYNAGRDAGHAGCILLSLARLAR